MQRHDRDGGSEKRLRGALRSRWGFIPRRVMKPADNKILIVVRRALRQKNVSAFNAVRACRMRYDPKETASRKRGR
jgi:hypothetical protein